MGETTKEEGEKMSDYGAIGEGIVRGFKGLFIALVICVPLAIWKLIEIVGWLWKHIDITVQ